MAVMDEGSAHGEVTEASVNPNQDTGPLSITALDIAAVEDSSRIDDENYTDQSYDTEDDLDEYYKEGKYRDTTFDNIVDNETIDPNIPSSKLCQYCQNIFDNWPGVHQPANDDNVWTFPHWRDPIAVETSAKTACALCDKFCRAWCGIDGSISKKTKQLWGKTFAEYKNQFSSEGKVTLRKATPDEEWNTADVWVLELPFKVPNVNWSQVIMKSLAPSKFEKPILETETSMHTENSLPIAKWWFKRCKKAHPECYVSGRVPFCPSRLLFIGDDRLRLCIPNDSRDPLEYAALSHCWGKTKFQTLKIENLSSFQIEIPSAALSKTFKEAIRTSKYLGIQYLWIDSLCIIQNDPNDWAIEASRMSDIYSSSVITLAASRAADGSKGLFFNRTPNWKCQIWIGEAQERTLYQCWSQRYTAQATESPLETRGWCLRERMLPKRTVHFTNRELVWECHQKSATELFPSGIPRAVDLGSSGKTILKTPIRRDTWHFFVGEYSKRNLTFRSDKLVAIAGLARKIQAQIKDHYYAGLWHEDLESQLFWHAGSDYNRPPNLSTVVPSWSWVSFESQVVYGGPGGSKPINAEVQNVDIKYVQDDIFGEVSQAALHIRCDALFHGTVHTKHWQIAETNPRFGIETAGQNVDILRILDYSPEDDTVVDTYILPVNGFGGHKYIQGLLLQPTGQSQGEYRRIGYFKTSNQEAIDFENACLGQTSHVQDWAYASTENNSHMIILV